MRPLFRPRALPSCGGRAFFGIFNDMKIEINPRGNGACPLCKNSGVCRFKSAIAKSLSSFEGLEMEIVIYQCQHFAEKA
jgi:hypothetical protein